MPLTFAPVQCLFCPVRAWAQGELTKDWRVLGLKDILHTGALRKVRPAPSQGAFCLIKS